MEKPIYVSDIEMFQISSFIDVLEVIENYENIHEVKEDIKIRKKYIKNEIEFLKKQKNKEPYYSRNGTIEILEAIRVFLMKNEWSYAKDYIEVIMQEMSKKEEICDVKFLKKMSKIV